MANKRSQTYYQYLQKNYKTNKQANKKQTEKEIKRFV